MHSSSSVGAGPYDPGGAAEDHDTPDDASPCVATMRQNQLEMHEYKSSHAPDLLQNKQKPEVSHQRPRRPRPHHPSEENLATLHPTPNSGSSGWCDLTVEYDRTGDTASELDDFSFAPAGTAAIVAGDNHEYVQGENNNGNCDEEEEGENDYVWGPQHLLSSRYNFALTNNQYGHGALEAASAAAASARSSGRQLVGSLYSHLPSYPRHGGGGELVETSAHSLDDDAVVEEESAGIIENEWPYELAPPATVSMSRGYSNSSDSDSLTRDIISSSVHTETYIFDDNQTMLHSPDKLLDDNEPLFSKEELRTSAALNSMKCSEDDDTSYATANSETHSDGWGEAELSGLPLVDGDTYEAVGKTDWKYDYFDLTSEHDDEHYFYNADEPTNTLRSEIVEVLQEDIGRVNEAFLDTIQKTSALVEPIAAVTRRQSTSSSPIRQRLSILSQSALGMSERASKTVAITIPTKESIREKSSRLWNKTHEAEETILYAAHKAEKSAIATAGKAMSHIHVPVPSMKMTEAISDALESVEAAAEELRVNDIDVQSGVDDAELLSQLTAGAYA